MDGVIVDTEPTQLNIQKEYLETLNLGLKKEEALKFAGASKKMVYEFLIANGASFSTFEDYQTSFTTFKEKNNFKVDYSKLLNPGIRDLLIQLTEHNLKLGLASSGSPEKIQKVLTQNNLEKYFSVVISGDSFEHSKPEPDIYITTLKELDVRPEETIVVEDSEYGIEAAKRSGIFTIALKDERFNFKQEKADIILETIDEITDYIWREVIK